MKLITKNTDYAMRALCMMTESNGEKFHSVSELSKRLNIPRPYLRRILQTLHKKKLLKACKGRGGGFTLAKRADEIFVFDLIKIFQGQFKLNNCIINVYEKSEESDGIRVLVDRLWPRGISKEKAKIDCWLREIAPADNLRKWFAHKPERWEEFRKRYLEELKNKKELMNELKNLEKGKTVTLLFSAKDTERNNAKVLLDYREKNEIPVRGNIKITVYGEPDEGSLGVIAQVFSYITAAASITGFKGLGGKFKRKDLLKFEPKQNNEASFKFERIDTNQKVLVKIYPHNLPDLGEREEKMSHLLEKIIWEVARRMSCVSFKISGWRR